MVSQKCTQLGHAVLVKKMVVLEKENTNWIGVGELKIVQCHKQKKRINCNVWNLV